MNIKSLLLGSAAALVAVSGARAADAVVIAEPEPMEYVRVCDTYGVGFYYIPGTETCLKVSGYIRYDIGAGYSGLEDQLDKDSIRAVYDEEGEFDRVEYDTNDGWYKRARFALRVDARSETELGTLRAYANINFNYDTVLSDPFYAVFPGGPSGGVLVPGASGISTNIGIEHAFIELGGFRAGVTDSMFSTFTGYSSGVANDGLVPYGPFGTHQMSYTFNGGNGFTAAVALETGAGLDDVYAGSPDINIYTIDSYVPHVVGGVGYTGGWGGVSVVAGYDSVWEEGAVKGRVDFNATEALSLFVMAGWSTTDDGPNYYAPWGGDWALWVGGAWKFNEKTTLNVEVGYDDFDNFSTVVGLDYMLVENFLIKPEIVYVDNFDSGYFNESPGSSDSNWGGFLRLQANFGG